MTTDAPPGWQRYAYGGAAVKGALGRIATRIPTYSLAYPPRWNARTWPDTLADYGQLDLYSPSGSVINVVLILRRPHGPTLSDLIAHDGASLVGATLDAVKLPVGTAVRLSGIPVPAAAGMASEILYLRRGPVVYRLLAAQPLGSTERAALVRIAATLRVPATKSGPPPPPSPPLPPQPPQETCCHCPAWGSGWGIVLTQLDGIPVYWNAGNGDNGCNGTYGISYQCVELAQRYFALRWGYPAIWSDVGAAADMPQHHPGDIQFVPNGGSPAPREGDAMVFYGGSFGHVAIVSNVDRRSGEIDFVEENWSPTGASSLPMYSDNSVGVRNSAYGSYIIAGWLHSPKNA